MSEAEHHNPFLDGLVELVGQENANRAVALADRARAHTASLLRAATEAVDPAPDQRAALAECEKEVAELKSRPDLTADLAAETKRADEAEEALVRRGTEINMLNDTVAQIKAELEAAKVTSVPQPGATPPAT